MYMTIEKKKTIGNSVKEAKKRGDALATLVIPKNE